MTHASDSERKSDVTSAGGGDSNVSKEKPEIKSSPVIKPMGEIEDDSSPFPVCEENKKTGTSSRKRVVEPPIEHPSSNVSASTPVTTRVPTQVHFILYTGPKNPFQNSLKISLSIFNF